MVSTVHRSILPGRLGDRMCPNAVAPTGQRLDGVLGSGFSIVTAQAPSAAERRIIEQCGAAVHVALHGSELVGWLRAGHATAAIIRPDRTVLRVYSAAIWWLSTKTSVPPSSRTAQRRAASAM